MLKPLLVASAVLGLGLAPSVASACSCAPTSIEQSWHQVSDTLQVRILGEQVQGGYRYYRAEVVRPFSGCTVAGDRILIETGATSAACGLKLGVGTEWLVAADAADSRNRPDVFAVGMCGYNMPWAQVPDADRSFLRSRPVSCGKTGSLTCADGTAPVQCIADPCETAAECGGAEKCESNYCGGCTAEFYTAAYEPVCRQ